MTKHALILIAVAAFGCGSKSSSTSGGATLDSLDITDALSGKQGLLRVNFDNPVPSDTDVTLTSSATAIATVPAKATVLKGQTSTTVSWMGVAPGSSGLTVTAGGQTVQGSLDVVDKVRVQGINLAGDSVVEKGATIAGGVFLDMTTPTPVTVTLASSSGSVASVPASVTVAPWQNVAMLPISAAATGTAQLTATVGDSSQQATIIVVDKAHLTAAPLSFGAVEAGGVLPYSPVADAAVAKPSTVTATSSDKSVATVDDAVIPAGSSAAETKIHALAAGTTTIGFALNGSMLSAPLTVVAKASLLGVSIGSISVGQTTPVNLQFDAFVANDTTVTISVADPTIVSAPAHVVVAAGARLTGFELTGLAVGATTLTLTANGKTVTASVVVTTLTLALGTPPPLVVGATKDLFISGPGDATITLSDPTVVSVTPASPHLPLTVELTALAAGSTTLTVKSGGQTVSTTVTVVAKAQLTLSTDQLQVNEIATESIQFSAIEPGGTMVTFTSSNPSVIAAPAPQFVPSDSAQMSFTMVALATGTTIITATVDGVSTSAAYYVGTSTPPVPTLMNVDATAGCVEVGGAVDLGIGFTRAVSSDTTITLSAAPAGIVSLPSSVALLSGRASMIVPVSALAVGSVTITASSGGATRTTPLMVVQNSTLTLNLAASITRGTPVAGSVVASCALANPVTVTVMSSDTTALTVSPASVTLGPAASATTGSFEAQPVAMGSSTVSVAVPSGYTAPASVAVTVN